MKKYRVNESEHFNLYSMHDKLKCIEIDMQEHRHTHIQTSSGMRSRKESAKSRSLWKRRIAWAHWWTGQP